MARELRLILGDQLNARHSWYRQVDPDVLYVMAELRQETDYVVHHVQKVLAFFAAMRKFSQALKTAGHQVLYLTLDDTQDWPDLLQGLAQLCATHKITSLRYQAPDEYRLDQMLSRLPGLLDAEVFMDDTEHFLTSRDAWQNYPNNRMEFFYRALRRHYRVLLDEAGQPLGGRWNFDQENRHKLPAKQPLPSPLLFDEDVTELHDQLQRHAIQTLGQVDPKHLIWPLTRKDAKRLFQFFLEHCLADFGRYQDAMTDRGWSLFHSRLSFCLNTKMLHPLEIIQTTENYWKTHQEQISLAQVEGFIRQILGWREYVRALYWEKMPGYAEMNELAATRPLPEFYWHGKTHMACMAQAIQQSLEHAYAHHIQRLMLTGNFALLTGIHPDQVDAWYLGIYIDAIEWVELPNTRGMSQFADGGWIASKPYAASANYIHKMSDHCAGCHYDHKRKTGQGSCPFNSLYWHFLHRHRDQFCKNPRLALTYANWNKFSTSEQEAILATAETYLQQLDQL